MQRKPIIYEFTLLFGSHTIKHKTLYLMVTGDGTYLNNDTQQAQIPKYKNYNVNLKTVSSLDFYILFYYLRGRSYHNRTLTLKGVSLTDHRV